ncbi:glycine oxidase ThiO [Hyalangium minutum]|uniref:Glycine oxidase ThiO n=1 Tax=Hyalangium minutum TaxID=394096 RepID=A0A085WPE1_9BACT|nr:glycine oxidase ThiO [Hyalangium minutum]KFE69554.1 Glycine oxidase ThiO [Hyalangium minutum]
MSLPDVIIVGGGVMGCGIALRLRQAGMKVTVLERSIPGAEASSAAAGILAPQMESDGPGPFLELCLRSRALYGALAAELRELTGVDIAYLPCGVLKAGFNEAEIHHLEATVAWQKALGLRADLLDGKQAREFEPKLSPHALAAAHFPDDHQVDNRLLVRALSMAAARVGATFRSGYVRGVIEQNGRAAGVDLDGDLLSAGAVIVAAGSWSGLVHGTALDPHVVRPARGQMIELQTRLPVTTHILTSEKGYLVPRTDGRLIAGSTMEFAGFDKQVTAEGLARILAMAQELCPALATASVTSTWAGFRPYTEDKLPILGPGPLPGLFLATGHFRNGILLAPITAKLLTQCLLGERPSLDLSHFRYDRFSVRAPM